MSMEDFAALRGSRDGAAKSAVKGMAEFWGFLARNKKNPRKTAKFSFLAFCKLIG